MKIIYFSMTGNIERFSKRVDFECTRGNENMIVDEDFILITYTIKFGEVPRDVAKFVELNKTHIKGVIGSGNKNWGIYYCNAAKLISEQYNVELLQTFELAGNIHDVTLFNSIIKKYI